MKRYGMEILFCLILWTKTSHSITTSIQPILEKSSPRINVRRLSKPVPYYHNSSATMRLLLSADIESNPGLVKPTESNRNCKKNKSFASFCQECNKTVKANSKRLLCIHCNNLVYLKRIDTNSTTRLKSYDPQRWICCRFYLKELPFLKHKFFGRNYFNNWSNYTEQHSFSSFGNK